MSIKNLKIKFKRITKKGGFTLIEIMAALAVSSISLLAIIQISILTTKQSVKNDSADNAVQISSATSDLILLNKSNVLLCSYANTNSSMYNPIYIDTDSSYNITFSNSIPTDIPSNQILAIQSPKPLPNVSPALNYGVTFVQDVVLKSSNTNTYFYRYIDLNYNTTYKIMVARIIIYWSVYNQDNYYSNSILFSVNDVCS